MKRISILTILMLAAVAVNVLAKPDKDDSKYTDEKVGKVQKSVEYHETRIKALETSVKKDSEEQNKRIAELEKKVDDLSKELTALDKWAKEKWGIGVQELEKVKDQDPKVPFWVKLLLFAVAAVLLAVLGFAFWPRKTVSPSSSADSSDRPKCPRCGWEHDPKDTVCKNPNCKTQF